MPEVLPPCPEGCGNRLKHRTHKTCGSRSCQGKRHRRLAKAKKAQEEARHNSPYTPEVRDVAKATGTRNGADSKDLAVQATREECRAIVREAMTDDIVASLQGMVLLVPAAKEALQKDLESVDPVTRQRAYELVFRYTLGNKSIAPPPKEQQPSPMTVVLNVPGSGAQVSANAPVPVDAESEEIRECMECRESKPAAEFVANSDRCLGCHDAVVKRIEERFGKQ